MATTWRKTEQVTAGALPAAVGKATAPDTLAEKTAEGTRGIVLIRVGGLLGVCVGGERGMAIAAVPAPRRRAASCQDETRKEEINVPVAAHIRAPVRPPRKRRPPVAAVPDTAAAVAAGCTRGIGTAAADTGRIGRAVLRLALSIPEREAAERAIVLHAAIAAVAAATAVRLGGATRRCQAVVPLPQRAGPTAAGLQKTTFLPRLRAISVVSRRPLRLIDHQPQHRHVMA